MRSRNFSSHKPTLAIFLLSVGVLASYNAIRTESVACEMITSLNLTPTEALGITHWNRRRKDITLKLRQHFFTDSELCKIDWQHHTNWRVDMWAADLPAAEHQEDWSAVVRVQSTPISDSCRTTPHRHRQCHACQLCSRPRCLPGRRCVHDNTHFTNGCELLRHPTPDTERPEVAASSCCYVAGHQLQRQTSKSYVIYQSVPLKDPWPT